MTPLCGIWQSSLQSVSLILLLMVYQEEKRPFRRLRNPYFECGMVRKEAWDVSRDRQFILLAGAEGMWRSGEHQCQLRVGGEGSAKEGRLYSQLSGS